MTSVLGFDYGRKRIGVAVGQTVSGSATALTTVSARDGQPDWRSISALIQDWQPELLVVGLPLSMDGSEHELTQAARRFGNRLAGRYNLPVEFVDERLTSVEAEARQVRPPRPGDIDKIAAQIILQDWLDSRP
ncbi:MAG: Holliday junction resolvase [Gammaproteobacteria bacterium SG8_47]|nr:MAG: Holliday junction resolvase [Gammaproteobacteria bacterium SG8_47]